jgi:hypothetical protein
MQSAGSGAQRVAQTGDLGLGNDAVMSWHADAPNGASTSSI